MQIRNAFRLVLTLAFVLQASVLVASTTSSEVTISDAKSVPSKVCHPKKPATCRAEVLPNNAQSAPALSPEPAVTAQEFERVCLGARSPWCRANTVAEPVKQEVAQEFERVCLGARSVFCRANTFAEPAKEIAMDVQQERVCLGARSPWCRANTLG